MNIEFNQLMMMNEKAANTTIDTTSSSAKLKTSSRLSIQFSLLVFFLCSIEFELKLIFVGWVMLM
jgi:hypothetical protein